jgi:hypothetical protein
MPAAIATLIMMLVLVLFPVLIPATVTALHELAKLRRSSTQARAERYRIEYVVEPTPASI